MEVDKLLRGAGKALVNLDAEAIVAFYAPEFLLKDATTG